MNSEKQAEASLTNCLSSQGFRDGDLFYHPAHHADLKAIFANCSKSGNGIGIPDRIFYNSHVIVIFECKKNNLEAAKNDIKHYFTHMNIESLRLKVFGVAYISDSVYSIFRMSSNRRCCSIKKLYR